MEKLCLLLLLCLIVFACNKTTIPPDTDPIWQKLDFSLKNLDQDGLYGPASGKVALNYEFCIPNTPKTIDAVKRIDSKMTIQQSKGRVGCDNTQVLCIGSSHQKNYKEVLFQLCKLPYVKEIRQTFWE